MLQGAPLVASYSCCYLCVCPRNRIDPLWDPRRGGTLQPPFPSFCAIAMARCVTILLALVSIAGVAGAEKQTGRQQITVATNVLQGAPTTIIIYYHYSNCNQEHNNTNNTQHTTTTVTRTTTKMTTRRVRLHCDSYGDVKFSAA